MFHMQTFDKELPNVSSDFYTLPKNQRLRPSQQIIQTEDGVPVRKLYFSVPSAEITKELLYDHFQNFGRIDSFTLHLKLSYCYGFVQYNSVFSATSVLYHRNHYVSNIRIKVSMADSWLQPTTEVDANEQNEPITDDKNNALHILDLNDDCLYHIFSMFNCIDLSAVDQTCTRFQRVASDVFRLKHTAINLTMTDLPGYSNVHTSQLTLFQIRHLFIDYGSQIQKLQVAALSFNPENQHRVLELIIRSCTVLNSLFLSGFHYKENLYRVNTTLFSNLQELSFSLCEINDRIRYIFANCVQLRKLTVQSVSNLTGSCLAMTFPCLESITFMNSNIEIRHIYTFFKLNRRLKSVKIADCGRHGIFDEIFTHIANNLPELESLTVEVEHFRNFATNIMSLLRLEHLRELRINCDTNSIAPFIDSLAAKGKIEVLHLSDGLLNDALIDAIGKCKKITSLKLCSMPSVKDRFLVELAKNLIHLNDFHISNCQTLTATGVIQFASTCKKLNSLHINNSSVKIDDKFLQSLATVFEDRKTCLTLSLSKITSKVTEVIIEKIKKYVQVMKSNMNDVFLYDMCSDASSDTDDDYDDDNDSAGGDWRFDPFDDDVYSYLFDINPNQWNFSIE